MHNCMNKLAWDSVICTLGFRVYSSVQEVIEIVGGVYI